ncbi:MULTISPECIES: hypothetical protein [unclassified Mycolicibacterium]|uniref:hypothetical protein n=1 Tax=unclassified Mycolicibacterium TaxID=2636767 RepID=UPI002ED80EED
MADVNEIRDQLVGNSGRQVTLAFVLAVGSVVRWPVDAFKFEHNADRDDERIFYWIQGNAIGKLTARGDSDSPAISAIIHPVSEINNVVVLAKRVDQGLGPGEIRRAITVSFVEQIGTEGSESESALSITIDAANETNPNARDQADNLINAILDAVAGHNAS